MRLLLAGGGTGGHVFPAVAVAEALRHQQPEAEVLFVGTERGMESRLLPKLGWPLATVAMRGVVGRGWRARLTLLPTLLRALWQGRAILRRFRPDVVLGVGGYASVPVLLAAKLAGIPYLIHEQNARAGLANRLLGRWARAICLSLPQAAADFGAAVTDITGNPLRAELAAVPAELPAAPSLLVFGGSLGAHALNGALKAALPLLEPWREGLSILHQTGEDQLESVGAAYRDAGWSRVTVTPFIEDMAAAYGAATLVLCRAGATTVAELAAVGRPAVLVPYPYAAGDHQTANARALAEAGAALLLPQPELTPQRLAALLGELLVDRSRLLRMAAAARGCARPGAAEAILARCRAATGKDE